MGSNSNRNSSSFNFSSDKIYISQTNASASTSTSKTPFNEGHVAGSRSTTSSSSLKRGPSQGQPMQQQQPMGRCQVEGCGVDLTGAKSYYCKHRVCGPHSKSPRVIVSGIEQRFCQQCSRFHLLSEFDQGKRSCRRRLAGHNERRRKPPPGPLLTTHSRHYSPFLHEDGGRSRGFIMDFTKPRATIEFGSNEPSHNPTLVQSNTSHFSQTPTSHQFFSRSNETLANIPSSTCALSLLSSPVQWRGPAGTDSFQNSIGFRGPLEGNTSANSVLVHQNIGLEISRTDTSRFSGELESALHASRQRILDDNSRVYGHGDSEAGHDVVHWSL